MQGCMFRLREVKISGCLEAGPPFEFARRATICYIVQDETNEAAEIDSISNAPVLRLEVSLPADGVRAEPASPACLSSAAEEGAQEVSDSQSLLKPANCASCYK